MPNKKVIPGKIALEYQKAQDSAEHFENMIWTLFSIGISFSVIILYLVWAKAQDINLELIMLFVGGWALFYFSSIIEEANEKSLFKYDICKKIEEEYSFKGQHLMSNKLPITSFSKANQTLRIMKIVLFLLYIVSIFINLVGSYDKGVINSLILFGSISVIIALLFALYLEFRYIRMKYDFNKVYNSNQLPLKFLKNRRGLIFIHKHWIRKFIFIFLIIILLLLWIGSYKLIKQNSSPNMVLTSDDYEFDIYGLDGKYARDLFLFYDFEEGKGYFKFRSAGKGRIGILSIELPEQLIVTEVIILNSNTKEKLDPVILQPPTFTNMVDVEIDLREKYVENIEALINITNRNNTFYPNGRFRFVIFNGDNITLKDISDNDGRSGSLLKFNFGNKYRCSEQCFTLETTYTDAIIKLFPNQDEILISAERHDINMGRQIVFTLSTFNLKKVQDSNLKLGIGISLFTGIIVAFLSFLLSIFYRRIRRRI